jgi:predicted amidohydrolase
MFDVDLPDGSVYRESKMFHPGDQAVLAPTPWGPLGMTICYDLRFPQLYRDLAQAGARLLTVPAAFTKVTGDAHWELLLRARAVENGCFVFAPCQTGDHPGNRRTCGHSLIIDPWGAVLADGGTEVGFVTAKVDMAEVDRIRTILPSLTHDRAYRPPAASRAEAAELPVSCRAGRRCVGSPPGEARRQSGPRRPAHAVPPR